MYVSKSKGDGNSETGANCFQILIKIQVIHLAASPINLFSSSVYLVFSLFIYPQILGQFVFAKNLSGPGVDCIETEKTMVPLPFTLNEI